MRHAEPNWCRPGGQSHSTVCRGLQHLREVYQPACCSTGDPSHITFCGAQGPAAFRSAQLCLQEGTQADLILQSLEACSICLRILVAPGMPKQIFREDIVELMLDLTRFQLLHNVLVFHDERIRQANKSTAGQGELSLLASTLALHCA